MRWILALVLVVVLLAGALAVLHYKKAQEEGGLRLADERFEKLVEGAQSTLEVKVEAIGPDGLISPEYTCDGFDKAPLVRISGIPGEARAVALIVYDPDAPAGTFIHWLVVKPVIGPEEVLPATGMVEGRNDFGGVGYRGPCPPPGHGFHRYFFLALALDGDPGLREGYTLGELLDAVRGHVIAWGYTMGKYSR